MKLREIRESNGSFFITGGAGTGKSTLLTLLALGIKKENKKLQIISPTGIAAQNVAGQTLHSFLGISHKKSFEENRDEISLKFNLLNNQKLKLDVVIIDEISMFSIANFRLLDIALRRGNDPYKPFGGVRMLIFGDFLQLPPIPDADSNDLETSNKEEFAFESEEWKELNPQTILMKKIHRVTGEGSESEFWIETLNKIRLLENKDEIKERLSEFIKEEEDSDYNLNSYGIYSSNDEVEFHNHKSLNKIEADLVEIPMEKIGEITPSEMHFFYEEEEQLKYLNKLNLKIGARIIFIKSDSKRKRYFNGTRGYVERFYYSNENEVIKIDIKLENDEIVSVEKYKFATEQIKNKFIYQFPIRLSYAFTVNKSQGQTIKEPNKLKIKLSSNGDEKFIEGKLYTALSRVQHPSQINLTQLSDDVMVQPAKALEWYKHLESDDNHYILEEYDLKLELSDIGIEVDGNSNLSLIMKEKLRGESTSFKSKHDKIISEYKRNESEYYDLDSIADGLKYDDVYDLKKGEVIKKYDGNKCYLDSNHNFVAFYRKDDNTRIPSVSNWTKILAEEKDIKPKNDVQKLGWEILRSKSINYGNGIDDSKHVLAYEGKVNSKHREILIDNLKKLKAAGMKIVAVGVPVTHENLSISGEIDQILYHEETDTYFVSDTKTGKRNPLYRYSDFLRKVEYDEKNIWQLNLYIDILKSNNPDLKISNIGMIDWIRNIKEEFVFDKNKHRIINDNYNGNILSNPIISRKVEEEAFNKYIEDNVNGVMPDEKPYRNVLIATKYNEDMIPDYASLSELNSDNLVAIKNSSKIGNDKAYLVKKEISNSRRKFKESYKGFNSIKDMKEALSIEDFNFEVNDDTFDEDLERYIKNS